MDGRDSTRRLPACVLRARTGARTALGEEELVENEKQSARPDGFRERGRKGAAEKGHEILAYRPSDEETGGADRPSFPKPMSIQELDGQNTKPEKKELNEERTEEHPLPLENHNDVRCDPEYRETHGEPPLEPGCGT
ncbi:hypothetical protein U3A55_06545 [Salarchaeum sp. III]|uniref:hypothetical protein n=1 Tax=Salarchaeum sp. III TaxID=3107927 RepID=UPI002ED7D203